MNQFTHRLFFLLFTRPSTELLAMLFALDAILFEWISAELPIIPLPITIIPPRPPPLFASRWIEFSLVLLVIIGEWSFPPFPFPIIPWTCAPLWWPMLPPPPPPLRCPPPPPPLPLPRKLLLTITRDAPSKRSLRLSPTIRKAGNRIQHVLMVHDPDIPWHLHSWCISDWTCCKEMRQNSYIS